MSDEQHRAMGTKQPFRVDAQGICSGECGDSIEVYLELRENTIGRIAFRCDGCMSTVQAANGTAALAVEKPLDKALAITAVDVLEHLGGLGEEHEHCALIAVNALHDAVVNALRTRDEPWKRLYGPRR
ncbi:MAG: iron-sulfur cluster assembly scaffold protein [bacterium]